MENKECCQCGAKDKLVKLECGKYGCINCLNVIAQEQKEIRDYILNYLSENWQILKPEHQANALIAIAMNIRLENNLLDEENKNRLLKMKERMEKAFE